MSLNPDDLGQNAYTSKSNAGPHDSGLLSNTTYTPASTGQQGQPSNNLNHSVQECDLQTQPQPEDCEQIEVDYKQAEDLQPQLNYDAQHLQTTNNFEVLNNGQTGLPLDSYGREIAYQEQQIHSTNQHQTHDYNQNLVDHDSVYGPEVDVNDAQIYIEKHHKIPVCTPNTIQQEEPQRYYDSESEEEDNEEIYTAEQQQQLVEQEDQIYTVPEPEVETTEEQDYIDEQQQQLVEQEDQSYTDYEPEVEDNTEQIYIDEQQQQLVEQEDQCYSVPESEVEDNEQNYIDEQQQQLVEQEDQSYTDYEPEVEGNDQQIYINEQHQQLVEQEDQFYSVPESEVEVNEENYIDEQQQQLVEQEAQSYTDYEPEVEDNDEEIYIDEQQQIPNYTQSLVQQEEHQLYSVPEPEVEETEEGQNYIDEQHQQFVEQEEQSYPVYEPEVDVNENQNYIDEQQQQFVEQEEQSYPVYEPEVDVNEKQIYTTEQQQIPNYTQNLIQQEEAQVYSVPEPEIEDNKEYLVEYEGQLYFVSESELEVIKELNYIAEQQQHLAEQEAQSYFFPEPQIEVDEEQVQGADQYQQIPYFKQNLSDLATLPYAVPQPETEINKEQVPVAGQHQQIPYYKKNLLDQGTQTYFNEPFYHLDRFKEIERIRRFERTTNDVRWNLRQLLEECVRVAGEPNPEEDRVQLQIEWILHQRQKLINVCPLLKEKPNQRAWGLIEEIYQGIECVSVLSKTLQQAAAEADRTPTPEKTIAKPSLTSMGLEVLNRIRKILTGWYKNDTQSELDDSGTGSGPAGDQHQRNTRKRRIAEDEPPLIKYRRVDNSFPRFIPNEVAEDPVASKSMADREREKENQRQFAKRLSIFNAPTLTQQRVRNNATNIQIDLSDDDEPALPLYGLGASYRPPPPPPAAAPPTLTRMNSSDSTSSLAMRPQMLYSDAVRLGQNGFPESRMNGHPSSHHNRSSAHFGEDSLLNQQDRRLEHEQYLALLRNMCHDKSTIRAINNSKPPPLQLLNRAPERSTATWGSILANNKPLVSRQQQQSPPPLLREQQQFPTLSRQQQSPPPLSREQQFPTLARQQQFPTLARQQQQSPPTLALQQQSPPPLERQQQFPTLSRQQQSPPQPPQPVSNNANRDFADYAKLLDQEQKKSTPPPPPLMRLCSSKSFASHTSTISISESSASSSSNSLNGSDTDLANDDNGAKGKQAAAARQANHTGATPSKKQPKDEPNSVLSYEDLQRRLAGCRFLEDNFAENLRIRTENYQKELAHRRELAYIQNAETRELRREFEKSMRAKIFEYSFSYKPLFVVGSLDTAKDERVAEFIPLTEEHMKRFNDLISGAPHQVIVSKFSLQITRNDIRTLLGSSWLNDEVINFYMNLLTERSELRSKELPSVYAMNTFFVPRLLQNGHGAVKRWTRKVDLFSKDIIPVPVHCNGVHWCMAIIHMRNKTIRYYDSMGKPNPDVLDALESYLRQESLDKRKQPFDTSSFKIESVPNVPQQTNGSDCGVFSCMFAEYISRDAPITFSQDNMDYFRKKMVLEIADGKLWK